MTITDFIDDFKRRYRKCIAYDMTVTDGAETYRLLKSANISKSKQTITKATAGDLT